MFAARARTLLLILGCSAFAVACGDEGGRPPVSDSLTPSTPSPPPAGFSVGRGSSGGTQAPTTGNNTATGDGGGTGTGNNTTATATGNTGTGNTGTGSGSVPGFGGTGDFAGGGSPPGFGGSSDFGRGAGFYSTTPGGRATTPPATGPSETINVGP